LLDVPAECWVLTSSEADTLARREGFPALKLPSKSMMRDAGLAPERWLAVARSWVLSAVSGLGPDLLLVDTFPGGSFGELIPVLEMARRRVLVARRVRDDVASDPTYRALLPLYHDLVVPDDDGVGPVLLREAEEMLDRGEARRALGVPDGARAVWLTLGGGGDLAAPEVLGRLLPVLSGRGWHVVVAAGPLYQGPERRGPGITWIDRYATMELLAGVDAAVSAAGYNSFHELMFAGVPTVFLPQPRIADDQDARADRAARAGAGRVAGSLDEVPDLLEAPGSPEAARALVPRNGAKEAALRALATLFSERDLQMASQVLTPNVIRLLVRAGEGGRPGTPALGRTLELVRLLGGGTPTEQARRRSMLEALGIEGNPGPSVPAVERFTAACERHGVPPEMAFHLVQALARKFPAASGGDLATAAEILFPAWAPFDDWMGALSLLRAVPVQRGWAVSSFAEALAAWLAGQDDLFEALRAFTRQEGAGQVPVAAVLAQLTRREGG
jgi:hypothetical protein